MAPDHPTAHPAKGPAGASGDRNGNRGPTGVSRRSLLAGAALTGWAGWAGWAVAGGATDAYAAPPPGAASPGPAGGTVSWNDGWLFGGEYVEGAAAPDHHDDGFTPVTLPHVVTPLSWRDWDPAAWQKVWAYRRHFDGTGLAGAGGRRVFLDLDGSMVTTTLTLNGHPFPPHRGGYLPWSVELTDHLVAGDNVLAAVVDARWSSVPPDGAPDGAEAVDYLQPGGLYRDVRLRVVPRVFVADIRARPVDVLTADRRVEVACTLDAASAPPGPVRVRTELWDGERRVASAATTAEVPEAGRTTVPLVLEHLGDVTLWSPTTPALYQLVTTVGSGAADPHRHTTRIGFREARFEEDGFFLNGERFKLFGLNRHQLYPYAGMAMPARVQRRDAEILRHDLNCTMVRCSHYPQSPAFLDACDELGLMVWQEPPGWQYVGDAAWQDLLVRDVHDMVVRDRNRPSVIIWGTRPNEAANHPDLYARTRAVCDALDGSRPTSGSMTSQSTDGWAQDVFAFDDYHDDADGRATLLPPVPDVPYLITEAVGALDGPPYFRWTDDQETLAQQAVMHARVHDIARSDDRYAGLLGWCGIDYASLNGHTYRHVKWPGVIDGFRVPKPGAAFYRAQVDPAVRPVVEPAFWWDFGPATPHGPGAGALIGSNCDRLELYVDGRHALTARPATADYPHLAHPPFLVDLTGVGGPGSELRVDGYLGDRRAISRRLSADPRHDRLWLAADDPAIVADGSDATRVAFQAADRYGNHRPSARGEVTIELTGPGVLVGDSPFAFGDSGGVGAVWIRSRAGRTGTVRLRASHQDLGAASVAVRAEPGTTPPWGRAG